jgi:molybdopterin molybdotransferase
MKPGKPLAVGMRDRTHVLGLPGNPAAAVITFGLFGVPLLRALQGDASPVPEPLRARLGARAKHKPGRRSFLRGTLARADDGALVATPLAHQSSGSIATVAHADALIVLPEAVAALEPGAPVDVIALRDLGA